MPEIVRSMFRIVTGELKSFLMVQVTVRVPLNIHTETPLMLLECADTVPIGNILVITEARISAIPNI